MRQLITNFPTCVYAHNWTPCQTDACILLLRRSKPTITRNDPVKSRGSIVPEEVEGACGREQGTQGTVRVGSGEHTSIFYGFTLPSVKRRCTCYFVSPLTTILPQH